MGKFVEVHGRKFKIYANRGRHGLRLININIRDISEIKGLGAMTHLDTLILDNNQLTEINGLETLQNLKILSLRNNQITEIKGLYNFPKLRLLNLKNNYSIKVINLL